MGVGAVMLPAVEATTRVQAGQWTPMLVHKRFRQAADTLCRLPNLTNRDVPHGPASSWPEIILSYEEAYGYGPPGLAQAAAGAGAIDALDEVIGWANEWLEPVERKLVWYRAWCPPVRWKVLTAEIGVGRTKAWEMWTIALLKIATRLNLSA